MKKVILLMFLFIPTTVQAKVKLCEKYCSVLKAEHINTIKGFLYDTVLTQTPDIKKKLFPKFARAIVWLNQIYEDEKIHVITKYKGDNASLIKASVEFIVDVVTGDSPVDDPQKQLTIWKNIGEKVIAEYSIEKKGKKTNIKWKLELLNK